jgi:hypothetical protein
MVRKNRVAWLTALLVVAAAAACSSSSSPSSTSSGGGNTPTPPGTITGQGTVGPSGGQVATSDGALTVTVPAGALPANTHITITEIQSPAPGAIGKTYDIGPTGTQFPVPVTLSFKYGGVDLAGADATSLEVATIVNDEWVALTNDAVDTAAQVATGQTTHFSPYGVHAKGKGNGNPDDSGTSSDATTTPDDGGNDAPVQDSGVQDSGFDASACTHVAQQVGSCANHPIQICSQGKLFTNCTDLQPMGYSAYCCPP